MEQRVWWVVAWDFYYPCGGLNNVKSTHTTKEAADEAAVSIIHVYDNVEVVDISDYMF